MGNEINGQPVTFKHTFVENAVRNFYASSYNVDFSHKETGITNHMAYISDIQQQTRISIDEEGVEASAFTQILYVGSAMPEGRADMILNRPFIYCITEPNGSLLFIGVCMNPLE